MFFAQIKGKENEDVPVAQLTDLLAESSYPL